MTAADGREFTISRSSGGAITRQCTSAAGKNVLRWERNIDLVMETGHG